jgi:hypothetical protein
MIVDGLLMLLIGVIQFVYDALPEWTIETHFQGMMNSASGGEGWSPIGGYAPPQVGAQGSPFDYVLVSMWQMNKFLPVDHFFGALSMVVTFFLAVVAYKVAKYIIGVVRGAGTS